MAPKAATLQERAVELRQKGTAVATKATEKTKEIVSNPKVQVTAAGAAGGAALATPPAATAGFLAGGTVGAAVGVIPALFTFGLSIPVGATIGSLCGVVVGGVAGSATGIVGGGAAGYGAYSKRAEIQSGAQAALAQVRKTLVQGKAKALNTYTTVKKTITEQVTKSTALAAKGLNVVQTKTMLVAGNTKTKAVEVASDRTVQVTTASAAGGAAVLGTGGGATGLLAGGALGAAVGLVPALFTFGLSIPVCAVIGGGCGLATGTALGSTTGAVAGGVGGYETYKHREAIGNAAASAKGKVQNAYKACAANVLARLA